MTSPAPTAHHSGDGPHHAGLMAAFALGHTLPRAGAAVVDTLVDTVAVTIAGQQTDTVRTLRRWLDVEPSAGEAPVWGGGGRLAPSRAALVNGTAAHALDYDDAGLTMPIHPSALLWPAVIAVSSPQTPTARLLAAVEAGHVLIRALGDVVPISTHYDRGWHASSTLGVLAATAACAAVAGLSEPQTRTALGIAASTAAGSLANFGTMTKPFHLGRAASDAVQAVGLARAGFTANMDELDDARGFLARYGAPTGAADLGERIAYWRDAWVGDCAVKQFAACFGTHRALAAAVRLRPEIDGLDDVRQIRVEAHPATLRPLRAELPTTGDEARFSMAFNVAQVLRAGGVGPGDFTREAIAENADLMARVRTVGLEAPSDGTDLGGRRFARVEVDLADGRTLARIATLDEPTDRPDPAAIDDKLVRCLTAVGVAAHRAEGLPARIRAAAAAPSATALDAVLSLHLIEEDAS